MDYAKVPPDIKISQVRPLEFLVLFFGQVCHGALEFRDDHPRRQGAGRKDAQFRLAGLVGVS